MKKLIVLIFVTMLVFTGCQGNNVNEKNMKNNANETSVENNQSEVNDVIESPSTFEYDSELGIIEVPANPQRIIVLDSFIAGSVMAMDVTIVGADIWAFGNDRYLPYLENAEEVSEENIEHIISLNPDLIIASSSSKNLERLNQIAPTVVYTYGKVDYLTQIIEVGKLLNKKEKAEKWVEEFKLATSEAGKLIKEKHGENISVTVIETYGKEIYVYGDNWGRGTEILYKEMKLTMPDKVKEVALESGYYAISSEVLPEYMGDYVVFSKDSNADNTFQETQTYKNIPAVKNNNLLEVEASEFYFNDPLTLTYQLEVFIELFLGE